MFKRTIRSAALLLSIIFAFAGTTAVYADVADETAVETVAAAADVTNVKAALLIDADTGNTLLEKNSDSKYSVAALSRSMTLLVISRAIDNGELKLDDVCVASQKAAKTPGSTAFIETNEQISVENAFKAGAMLLAGDALLTVAEKLSGTEEAFVQKLNTASSELGIDHMFESAVEQNTQFSAKELSLIAQAVLETKSVFDYSSRYMDEIMHPNGKETELVNPNKLVRFYSGCNGLATSSNSEAGYCGIFTAERDGLNLICVLIGAPNAGTRSETAQELFDYGFTNFEGMQLAAKGEIKAKDVAVDSGTLKSINALADEDIYYLANKNEAKQIDEEVVINEQLSAPIAKGAVIGYVVFRTTDKEIARCNLVCSDDVLTANFGHMFMSIIRNWLRLS